MFIKFLAKTQEKFPFSTSGRELKKGDVVSCSKEFAEMALEKYPEDFEIVKEPSTNKMLSKTTYFKSK